MIKNTKIIRFNINEKIEPPDEVKKDFDIIDGYEDSIKKYIYDNISVMQSIDEAAFFQSRVQLSLSSILLRSLYLKEGIVVALNENNLASMYSNLKSFLEIPAMLGYVLYSLGRNISNEETLEIFTDLTMGNKEAGVLSSGSRRAVNVITMFEKSELVLPKKELEAEGKKNLINVGQIIFDFYQDICNYGHPNYNAHFGIVGNFDKNGVWRIQEGKREEVWGGFKPHLLTAIETIKFLCEKIVNHHRASNFTDLKNKLYFS
jgi:hypothetical protein